MSAFNACIRCGQQRIIKTTWTETLENGSTVKKSLTECPDADCQGKVNEMLLEKQKERARKEDARQARLARIHAKQLEIVASI